MARTRRLRKGFRVSQGAGAGAPGPEAGPSEVGEVRLGKAGSGFVPSPRGRSSLGNTYLLYHDVVSYLASIEGLKIYELLVLIACHPR